MTRSFTLAAAATALLFTACSPGIHITRYRPAQYNLGATRKVALLNIAGPPEATGVIASELTGQIVSRGYYQLYSAQPQAITLVVVPGVAVVQNIETVRQAVPAEVYVSGTVMRWDYSEEEVLEEGLEEGKKFQRPVRIPNGHVAVHFQVVHAQTGQLVVARDYSWSNKGERYNPATSYAQPAPVLHAAADRVVAHFLGSITPATVTEKIVLDDEEPALEEGIAHCKQGALDAAMASFEKVLQVDPNSPGAAYNLGVLYEAQGEYAKAEELYKRAYQIKPRELYQEALQQMHRRIAEDESLRQRI